MNLSPRHLSPGPPGSLTFLGFWLLTGIIAYWLRPSWRRAVRAAVAGLVGLYAVLALPVVAGIIGGGDMAATPDSTRGITFDIIVVLDGDNRRGRTRAALSLATRSPAAPIRVLGERWIADALVDAGLDRNRIQVDARAATTREQLDQVRDIVRLEYESRIAVVASRLQMPRVRAIAQALRLDVGLVASAVDDEPARGGIAAWVPTYLALRVSRDGIYERAALRYYRWRGWAAEGR